MQRPLWSVHLCSGPSDPCIYVAQSGKRVRSFAERASSSKQGLLDEEAFSNRNFGRHTAVETIDILFVEDAVAFERAEERCPAPCKKHGKGMMVNCVSTRLRNWFVVKCNANMEYSIGKQSRGCRSQDFSNGHRIYLFHPALKRCHYQFYVEGVCHEFDARFRYEVRKW